MSEDAIKNFHTDLRKSKGKFARVGAESQLRLSLFYINQMFPLVRDFV